MNRVTCTPAQAAEILARIISLPGDVLPDGRVRYLVPLLEGPPGVGKTEICRQAASHQRVGFIHSLVSEWRGLAGGVPNFFDVASDDGHNGHNGLRYVAAGRIADALHATDPTLLLLDEAFSGTDEDTKTMRAWVHDREVNGLRLPDCVRVVAATNSRSHGAGLVTMDTAALSRFGPILHLTAHLPSWTAWATQSGIAPEIVAYLHVYPDALHEFSPNKEIENYPCPRTWERVSDAMRAMAGAPSELEMMVYTGIVGPSRGTEFTEFLRLMRTGCDIEQVLRDPQNAGIPSTASGRWGIAVMLVHKMNLQHVGAAVTYCQRMYADDAGSFAAYALHEIMRKIPASTSTADWQRMWATPLGSMIRGIA